MKEDCNCLGQGHSAGSRGGRVNRSSRTLPGSPPPCAIDVNRCTQCCFLLPLWQPQPIASAPHPEPADFSAILDIPLELLKDLKKKEKELQAREAELNQREKAKKEEAAAQRQCGISQCAIPAVLGNSGSFMQILFLRCGRSMRSSSVVVIVKLV